LEIWNFQKILVRALYRAKVGNFWLDLPFLAYPQVIHIDAQAFHRLSTGSAAKTANCPQKTVISTGNSQDYVENLTKRTKNQYCPIIWAIIR
jgi:uncharacterized membrane protein (Fun14 family)